MKTIIFAYLNRHPLKKQIRFEHNIKFPKSGNGRIVMKVLEIHDGLPMNVYEIPMLPKNKDVFARFHFYYPNFN